MNNFAHMFMHVCVCVFVCLCNRSPSRRALGLCVCFPFFFSTIYSFATEPYAIGILVSCCSSTVRQKARKWQDRILRFFTVTRAKQREVVRGKGRAASKRKKMNNTNANAHPVPPAIDRQRNANREPVTFYVNSTTAAKCSAT